MAGASVSWGLRCPSHWQDCSRRNYEQAKIRSFTRRRGAIMADDSLAEILERSTRRCREADAPLADRLRLFAEDVRTLSPDFAEVVDRMIGRLQASGAGLAAPK